MRFRILSAVLAVAWCVATATSAYAQKNQFEGVVKMNMYNQGGDQAMPVTYYTKGSQSRMEMTAQGQPAIVLVNLDTGVFTTVMPTQKMYMVIDPKKMAQGKDVPKDAVKLTKTGKSETIAGYACDHYLVGAKQDNDLCVATTLGLFAGQKGSMLGGPNATQQWEQYAAQFPNGFFPLKIEHVEGGNRQMVMLVTSIQKVDVADGMFAVPAGYTEMKMPANMGVPQP